MTTVAVLGLAIGTLSYPGASLAESEVFPTLPRGTYVAAQYTCTEYIEVGLLRLDARGFSPAKSTCTIVSSDPGTSTYQASCHDNDAPSDNERVTLKIEPLSKSSVKVNGTTYNYCKGL